MLFRAPSNVGESADDKAGFDRIFWQRLCQKYRHLSTNTNTIDFVFDFRDIRRDVNKERGLGIDTYGEPFIEQGLLEIEKKGLIELVHDRKFRLTQAGIEHCERSPVTNG